MTIEQQLQSGAVLRYRQGGIGFYLVKQGVTLPIDQTQAERAVRQGVVRLGQPEADKFGVWHFALNKSAGGKKK